MKYITGTYNNGAYKMHGPEFPYTPTTYIGYTRKQMERKYREDHDLKGKRLTWVILGEN